MYDAVWGEYQPQPWCYGIISAPQVDLTSQIWGQLSRCNCTRVHPYALETAYQRLKHLYILLWMYEVVWSGCQPQPSHYGIISTPQVTLSPQIWGQPGHCNGSMPKAQTLCVCLLWITEAVWNWYQPQPWCYGFSFTLPVTLSPQICGQPGSCNSIRVQPYVLETAYQLLKHSTYA